jgi:hypothetical protein
LLRCLPCRANDVCFAHDAASLMMCACGHKMANIVVSLDKGKSCRGSGRISSCILLSSIFSLPHLFHG